MSLGISPVGVHPSDAPKVFPASFKERLQPSLKELGRRLPIVSAARWAAPMDQRELAKQIMVGPPPAEQNEISLTAFADFADEMEWELPDGFPRLPKDRGKDRPTPAIKNPKDGDRPLRTRERTTLLVIVAALAKEAGFDVGETWKSAQRIEKLTLDLGARISAEAISQKLREIPDALERAGRLGMKGE